MEFQTDPLPYLQAKPKRGEGRLQFLEIFRIKIVFLQKIVEIGAVFPG